MSESFVLDMLIIFIAAMLLLVGSCIVAAVRKRRRRAPGMKDGAPAASHALPDADHAAEV